MYQALYRKWRPKKFEDVIGQEHITETLKSEVSSGRVSHAYLFVGSRGTGKTTCAKIFSRAVNCLSPTNGDPCDICEVCKEIQDENALDVIEIDAASNNSVDNIRSMREEVMFTPAKCKYRVYIVDEVHMLSTGAFNAFLKILEEPPKHIIFILATTEIHKIPSTIISRCQRFNFSRISEKHISERINFICHQEKIQIEQSAAELIAKSADGGMRDAISILDQCANSCSGNITLNKVEQILGVTSSEYVQEFAKNILNGSCLKSINLLDQLHKESKNMRKLCEEILEKFRTIMIESLNNSGDSVPLNKVLKILDILQNAYQNISNGSKPKLEMEIAFAKLCITTDTKKEAAFELDNQISNIQKHKPGEEKIIESSPPLSQESESKIDPQPIIKSETQLEASAKSNGDISGTPFKDWNKILNKIQEAGTFKSLCISLKESRAYENGNFVLIDSKNPLAFELLRDSNYRIAIKKIIKDITGKQYNLGPYKLAEQAKKPKDPLDSLIENAKKNNIDVTVN